jgi:magnesium chelatase family protein
MLAERLPTILPPLSESEAIEVTKLHSVAGLLREDSSLLRDRPFRAPHHTISDLALIGGGRLSRPGEMSLAHRGVLFLDELTEFRRGTLEHLRQSVVDRRVRFLGVFGSVSYPAEVLVVGTLSPCFCGLRGDETDRCSCTPGQLERYSSLISSLLLDCIDLQVEVPRATTDVLQARSSETSAIVRDRVLAARERQARRLKGERVSTNGRMDAGLTARYCLQGASAGRSTGSVEAFRLASRADGHVLRLARTIADLEGAQAISAAHVAEAAQFRGRAQEVVAPGDRCLGIRQRATNRTTSPESL